MEDIETKRGAVRPFSIRNCGSLRSARVELRNMFRNVERSEIHHACEASTSCRRRRYKIVRVATLCESGEWRVKSGVAECAVSCRANANRFNYELGIWVTSFRMILSCRRSRRIARRPSRTKKVRDPFEKISHFLPKNFSKSFDSPNGRCYNEENR